ncbi:MAG: type II toxin-antitoxin system VapC family toxin [Archaeoglobaceae archaeon]
MKAYTSTIAWGEVVWVIRKIFNFELSLEQGRRFLEFPNLKFLSVKKSTILVTHKLLERYKLKPRDALHAAVAIENGLTEIVSYDSDFDVLKELKRMEP